MAQLVDVYREDNRILESRQLPLQIDENLTMVMDLKNMGFVEGGTMVKGKKLDDFHAKIKVLSDEEIQQAFQVDRKDLLNNLSQTIPCVGCRRSVERLFYQLMESGHKALDPLVVLPEGFMTVKDDYLQRQDWLCTLLHGNSDRLNDFVDTQLRSKKSRRCALHSLDSHRTRLLSTAWRDVWSVMTIECRNEVVLIEASTLMSTLENYLQKHRFCGECRTKVLRAYALLVEEPEPIQEKGYVAALYNGIRRCLPQKHIHLEIDTEYISDLITRAEPELMSSRRERHAKTLEIAQEEVLTCLGICVYERLHRIHLRLREEECTCQVLADIALDALNRNFQKAVECKRGITQLELLFEEITKEEQMKQHRKEHKKLKRKKRKDKKAGVEEKENDECESEEQPELSCGNTVDNCTCVVDVPATEKCNHKFQVQHRENSSSYNSCHTCLKIQENTGKVINNSVITKSKCGVEVSSFKSSPSLVSSHNTQNPPSPCQSWCSAQGIFDDGQKGWLSSDHSQDFGYSSENNLGSSDQSGPSSPEGSEAACSEGFCNHHEGDCQTDAVENPNYLRDILRHSGQGPTLMDMLEVSRPSDEEESFIPAEEVQEFKAKIHHLDEKRQELRQILKKRFAQMCDNRPYLRRLPSDCE